MKRFKQVCTLLVIMLFTAILSVTVLAESSCTLHFNFNNTELNGTLECVFKNTKTLKETREQYNISNGVVDVTIPNEKDYYYLDYSVYNTDNECLTQQRGYLVSELPETMNINYHLDNKPAIGMPEEEQLRQLAQLLGVTVDEARELVAKQKPSVSEVDVNNTPVDKPTDNNSNQQNVETVVECYIDFGDILYLYPIDYVEIKDENNNLDLLPVNYMKFKYAFKPGNYTLTIKGCQPVLINIRDKMVTSISVKPERTIHLVKDVSTLHVIYDGIEWQGETTNGVCSFAALPDDNIIIDDVDGLKYSCPLSSGVHDYTLNLNTGYASEKLDTVPTQDISVDNPFGIPQTSERQTSTICFNDFGLFIICVICLFIFTVSILYNIVCKIIDGVRNKKRDSRYKDDILACPFSYKTNFIFKMQDIIKGKGDIHGNNI